MKVGPAPVVLHAKGGKLVFDPISTTLNEGHIRLEPEIDLNATGGPMLRLAKNSTGPRREDQRRGFEGECSPTSRRSSIARPG